MKTTFSRTFFPAAIILLLSLGIVGLLFQMVVRDIMKEQTLSQLEQNAKSVAHLAAAYQEQERPADGAFYVALAATAQAAGADTVLCDRQGRIVACSHAPQGCEHLGMAVEQSYFDRVAAEGSLASTGKIQGLYPEARYVMAVPVLTRQGQPVGMVISSISTASTLKVLGAMSNMYLAVSLGVILVSVLMTSLVASRHSRPLRQLSRAAVDFGHGNLKARVPVDPESPVEVQELSLAFNNMALSLEQSENQRQEFVANVSHELKTPMTTIAGFADGILDGTIPPERQSYYIALISQETKRLSRLVRSMLDISHLQTQGGIPEEKKTRFDMQECAGQVLIAFEQKISAKKLQVQVDMPEHPVYTRANQDYITQVLYNLIDNAVKFCPEEGQLGLRLRLGQEKMYVSVFNTGTAIPPEELSLVFDRFHKTDKSRSENRDGWGLGLYIVKTIVCSHGEDISVTSAEGKTEFTFTLPLVN